MCANYTPNANLKGSKVVYTSESAVSLGSSSLVPMIVCPVDPNYMQDTFSYDGDGYEACAANTNKSQVKYTNNRSTAVAKNEFVNQYVYIDNADEARLIESNTGAANGATVTLNVSRPFTTAPTTGANCNVRLWEKINVPKLMGSLTEFAEAYIAKDTAGDYIWTNQEASLDAISSFKNAGGGFFVALPCTTVSGVSGDVDANLAPTTDADFLTGFDLLPVAPDAVVLSKSPNLPVSIDASDWATADVLWTTFVDNRATQDTSDEDLTAMVYITDTPSASTSAAVTYRATTWAPTSERAVLVHGLHNVADQINNGLTREVNAAPAYAGAMNAIATGTAESFGNAFSGARTAFAAGPLTENITQANRLTLQSNGINALIFKRGRGYYFENEYTMKATTLTAGENPGEYLHVIVSRNKIWNAAKRKLQNIVDTQNVFGNRSSVVTELTVLLDAYKSQRIIRDYTVADTTTSADESIGIARFGMSVLFPVPIGWCELTLHSRI